MGSAIFQSYSHDIELRKHKCEQRPEGVCACLQEFSNLHNIVTARRQSGADFPCRTASSTSFPVHTPYGLELGQRCWAAQGRWTDINSLCITGVGLGVGIGWEQQY